MLLIITNIFLVIIPSYGLLDGTCFTRVEIRIEFWIFADFDPKFSVFGSDFQNFDKLKFQKFQFMI